MLINDHKKIITVYEKTVSYLQDSPNLSEELGIYISSFYELNDLIPQYIDRLGSGHFFPFLEAYTELENSIELSKQGFYRHALFCLRNTLELVVLGLYFDREDQAHKEIRSWFTSDNPTPRFSRMLDKLLQLPNFIIFSAERPIRDEVKRLYDVLSDFVHIRGFRYSSTGQGKVHFNGFSEQAFLRNICLLKQIVHCCIKMVLLKYPIGVQELPLWEKFGFNKPIGGFLESPNVVLRLLPSSDVCLLQKISNNDSDVQELSEEIHNMPDLTEEEIDLQYQRFDKLLYRHIIPSASWQKRFAL